MHPGQANVINVRLSIGDKKTLLQKCLPEWQSSKGAMSDFHVESIFAERVWGFCQSLRWSLDSSLMANRLLAVLGAALPAGREANPSLLLSTWSTEFWASQCKEIWTYRREPSKGPLHSWKDWNISAVRKGWENRYYSSWRRDSLQRTSWWVMLGSNKQRTRLLLVAHIDGTRGNVQKLKYRNIYTFFNWKSGQILEEVAKRCSGAFILGHIKNMSGCGWLWATCMRWPCLKRENGLDDLQECLPTSAMLWFCDCELKMRET